MLLSGPPHQHCIKRLSYVYIFENDLFHTIVVEQKQDMDVAGCRMISVFLFDILLIPCV